jgi:hypothetical protein
MGEGTVGLASKKFVAALSAFRRRRADLFCAGGTNVNWTNLDGWSAPNWEVGVVTFHVMLQSKHQLMTASMSM